ncbi:MAG TPA: hypothetical protein VIK27_11425 [Candidatus Aquilonibacter sp.]
MPERYCVLHIGTHKTGSTALQMFLKHNRAVLQAYGVMIPAQGYEPGVQIGHHRLASELMREDDPQPLLDELRDALASSRAPLAVLSSEEFVTLAARPERLARLAETLEASGRAIRVVVYLRPQAAWAESLYGERLRQRSRPPRFAQYVAATVNNGGFAGDDLHVTLPFAYPQLLRPFAERFGANAIVARCYRGSADRAQLYRDFVGVLAECAPALRALPIETLIPRQAANESFTLLGLLNAAYAAIHARPAAQLLIASTVASLATDDVLFERFALLNREEAHAFLDAFGASNRELERTFGTRVPFIEASDIASADDPVWQRARTHRAIYDACLDQWLADGG